MESCGICFAFSFSGFFHPTCNRTDNEEEDNDGGVLNNKPSLLHVHGIRELDCRFGLVSSLASKSLCLSRDGCRRDVETIQAWRGQDSPRQEQPVVCTITTEWTRLFITKRIRRKG
eukprot:scaffold1893_cov220-Amphora_coffeaeformis.AAC.9